MIKKTTLKYKKKLNKNLDNFSEYNSVNEINKNKYILLLTRCMLCVKKNNKDKKKQSVELVECIKNIMEKIIDKMPMDEFNKILNEELPISNLKNNSVKKSKKI